MRKLIFCLILLGLAGCGPRETAQQVVIKIDQIVVSREEFERAYETSVFQSLGEAGKKQFLDVFISRKLLLKKAEEMNLDKNPEFLSSIQLFWEQSLLKQIMAQKTQEIASNVVVMPGEIQAFYEQYQESFSDKPLEDLRDQIHSLLLRQRQQVLFQQWIKELKNKAQISVRYDLLDIPISAQEEARP